MRASFFHDRDERQASYRYRGLLPAIATGWPMHDESADIWIVAKITAQTPGLIERAHTQGKRVIVDVCDPHFGVSYYQKAIAAADTLTTPTPLLAEFLWEDFGRTATVIDDPYEFDEVPPHVRDANLLWFGHASNYDGLAMWRKALEPYSLRIVSNIEGYIPWSLATMQEEFARASIVLLPDSAPTKSANRTVEAIRQGCFVVAAPHPSLEGIPGIWIGNILEGVEWARTHHAEANQRVQQAQSYVQARYSPERVGNAWKTLVTACASSWAADINRGQAGSTSIATTRGLMPMSSVT